MSFLKAYLWVMAGGALGTAARMGISNFVAERYGAVFPTGTILVNITGCFIIGLVHALTGPNSSFLVPPLVRQTVMIGVLGGYTTFSSFSLQTLNLLNDGEWLYAGWNVALSVVCCLVACWLGLILGGQFASR